MNSDRSILSVRDARLSLSNPPGSDNPIFFGHGSRLVLFTLDTDFVCRYMSASSKDVTGIASEDWVGKKIVTLLTTHPCNVSLLRQSIRSLEPAHNQFFRCEVVGVERPVQLEVERHAILDGDEPIGIVAIARRQPTVNELLNNLCVIKDPIQIGPSINQRWSSLNLGERNVIDLLVQGLTNRSIAKRLGVSERTIEARRSKAMKKLGTKSMADITRVHMLVQSQLLDQEAAA